jgi:soluble lytic murein transglycosylase
VTDRELAQLTTEVPALQRAQEFHALDEDGNARREWQHSLPSLSERQLLGAAKLAHQWGWHDRAILALARAEYWDDLEARFPIRHRSQLESQARRQRLDAAWVLAVVRQESAFVEHARSPAGAVGLMQLMPATAKMMIKKTGLPRSASKRLIAPEVNIPLGTAYLRRVKEQLGDHIVLATAAYNAGPGRVRAWLPDHGTVPADVWVETVPFSETRTYLRRVLSYTVFYEKRLGRKTVVPLAKRMGVVRSRSQLAAGENDRLPKS